jgi:tRNA(Ile)-lysidine synthase
MNKQAVPLAVRRHQLVATVRKAIGNQDVLVGVSGGADSVALLLLCCAGALQESANYQVAVAHIHHGLRVESDAEQKMVEALCESLGVQCISTRVIVTPENGSLAAGARKARYEALQATATALGFNAVAVAHHAEDQLETMLMALCRGGGLRKLSGIAASRPLSGSIDLFRPLLHVEKNELISICNLGQIKWCEDPTNQNSTTPRGRLRQDVIPILRELWNSADRHASNASTMLHAAVDTFDATVPRGNEWDRVTFAKLPLPIIDAALQKAIGERATFESIQSIRDAIVDSNTEPRTFQLQNGNSATVTSKKVIIHHS